ncbi:MAG: cyclic nucleotide-binding domain-containing protein [Thiomonas sp.]
MNIYRLSQIESSFGRACAEALGPSSDARGLADERDEHATRGQWLRHKGDVAHAMVRIVRGRVKLVESNRELLPGQFFGEIAIFSETGRHPDAARFEDDCEPRVIPAAEVIARCDQDADFRLGIVRALAAQAQDRLPVYGVNAATDALNPAPHSPFAAGTTPSPSPLRNLETVITTVSGNV